MVLLSVRPEPSDVSTMRWGLRIGGGQETQDRPDPSSREWRGKRETGSYLVVSPRVRTTTRHPDLKGKVDVYMGGKGKGRKTRVVPISVLRVSWRGSVTRQLEKTRG